MFLKNVISSFFVKEYFTPFILYNNCIYLYKYWLYENCVVKFLNKNLNIINDLSYFNILLIRKLFLKYDLDYYQKIAVIYSLMNKITLISGGPGTGKTSLVVKLLIIFFDMFSYNKNSIAIVTPTGKSSSCLTNYLGKFYKSLNLDLNVREKLPDKSITIHKLLGFNYINNNLKFNQNNKLNIELLIIDESSMIDLLTFNYIFSSLNNDVKIILVGDSYQISSISAGSVFNEICDFSLRNLDIEYINFFKRFIYRNFNICYLNNLSLYKNVCFLYNNYRFSNNYSLNKLVSFVKLGDIKKIDVFLERNNFSKNLNFYDFDKFGYNHFFKYCIKKYYKYINFINNNINNLKINIFDFFNKFQLICVLRNSKFGVDFLNKLIDKYLLVNNLVKNIKFNKSNNCFFYLGKPIMIIKNNSDLNLNNGDLGFFVLNNLNDLKVIFEDFNDNYKIIHPLSLPLWENSWAITVYKSQGSEFDHVLLLLPNNSMPLLNRKLIYTAITRCKKRLTIYANKEILFKSINLSGIYFNNIKKNLC